MQAARSPHARRAAGAEPPGGAVTTVVGLSVLVAAGVIVAVRLRPPDDAEALEHAHDDLPIDHTHLKAEAGHSHRFVVDDEHARWASHL